MGDGAARAAAINARISASALKFNAEVAEFVQSIPKEKIVPFAKKIALTALRLLVTKTPVDTGRARGGWQVSIDDPPQGEPDFKGKQQLGTLIGLGQSSVLDGMGAYGIVHIYNNVSYIIWLEDGHSGQAPSGMVVVTIAELRQMFP